MEEIKKELAERARSFICSYCNITTIPTSLEFIIPVMVAEDFNVIGSEGISNKSAAGISEAYLNDYSEKVMKILRQHRKIKTI